MSCQIDEKNVFSSHLRILFKYVVNSYLNIDECSSLLCVSTIEDFDIVNLLGISLRFDDDHALRYASGCGHLPVVQYLVEKGADIHVMHDYSLRVAVKENHLHVVRFLVENGANIYIYIYIYIYILAMIVFSHRLKTVFVNENMLLGMQAIMVVLILFDI